MHMDDSKIAVELTQDQFQVVLGCLSETVGQLQISTKIATDLVGRLTTEEFGQFTNSELDILILSLNTFIGQAQLKTKEIEKAKSQVQKGAALTATKDWIETMRSENKDDLSTENRIKLDPGIKKVFPSTI